MTIDDIDREIRSYLPALASLGGTVKLDLGEEGVLFLDATGDLPVLSREDRDADCVLRVSPDNMRKLIEGRLNPLLALTLRKIKVDGDTVLAKRLAELIREQREDASDDGDGEPGEGGQSPEGEGQSPEEDGQRPEEDEKRPEHDAEQASADDERKAERPQREPPADGEPAQRPAEPEGGGERSWRSATSEAEEENGLRRNPPTVVVHARCAGRLRLRIYGLKGNADLAARIERQLTDRRHVRSASASARTGRLLLQFDPGEDSDAVLAQVRRLLARSMPARPQGSGSAHGAKPPAKRANSQATNSRRAAGTAPRRNARPWHAMAIEDVLAAFAADGARGLPVDEAATRLERYGANAPPEPEERSRIGMLIEQFASLPVGLLGLSAAISLATGGIADAVAIAAVLGINAAVGYVTESGAEKTIRSLTRREHHVARLRRDDAETEVPATEVVPGDLLILSAGMFVAADARLVEATELALDESMLTGESLPVRKAADACPSEDSPLGDRSTMVYQGTAVTGGSGRAVVVATGAATEIGAIRSMVGEARPPVTPLQRQLGVLGRRLAVLSGGICVAVLGVGLLRNYGFLPMLKASTALAVAAVPEGLPAVATTTLALGMRDMRRHKVLVRRLSAVETLGSVGVICFDKTGTLTFNRMTMTEARLPGAMFRAQPEEAETDSGFEVTSAPSSEADPNSSRADLTRTLEIGALCSEADFAEDGDGIVGSATEAALLRGAVGAGIDVAALRERWPKVDVEPRRENVNVMVTHHEGADGSRLAAVKGAPGEVLERCSQIRRNGRTEPLSEQDATAVMGENDTMAAAALRVLGVAERRGDGEESGDTWLGLVGMTDPLRPGMRDLMHTFHDAGIRTVMITGDQSATAYAIARDLDLNEGRQIRILESTKLDAEDEQLLAALTAQADVFARVSPAHKLRIVQGLQRAGHVVAMTGDGVNDGPALKVANVGVAMGAGGSEVAHELADIILEDDDIARMATAVARGRTIYGNIRKSVHFLLATNLSEVMVVFAGTALGLGQPLTPMQLLWINLVSDIFPGIALSLEPPARDVLRRPPRDPAEAIVPTRDLSRMAVEAAVITAGAMAAYGWGRARYGAGLQAGTMAFHSLTAAQLLHALSCRSDRFRAFSREKPLTPLLTASVLGSIAATVLATLLPSARRLIGVSPLGPIDWLVTAAGAVLPFISIEMAKPHLSRIGGQHDAPPGPPQRSGETPREET